jgi:predicted dinucleotide-binding enzyme
MTTTNIAVIGAGNVGGNLGARFATSGLTVKFGVKPGADTNALLARAGKNASATAVSEAAAWGQVVFLAVPGTVALEVAKSLANPLAGKIVVDCNNALTWKDGPVWAPPPEGSLAQAIAKALPASRVVKGWNTFGAEFHESPSVNGKPLDVMLAGDDPGAKQTLMEIGCKAGFHPIDAGPLRNAPVLENLAILWIHLAMVGGMGRDFAFMAEAR